MANSARYDVYLKDVESQKEFVDFAKSLDGVRRVDESKEAADMLTNVNRLIGYVSIAIILILLAVAFFLISNTLLWVFPFVRRKSES